MPDMRQSRQVLLKKAAFALLAAVITIGTSILVLAAGRFSLDSVVGGEPFTVPAALGLFCLVFVVVGAAVAVIRLVGALRRANTSGRREDPKP